ncbi:unnamed protein product, partial [Oncorhynchus mykiss]
HSDGGDENPTVSHKADCFFCFSFFFWFSVSLALSFRDNNFIKDFPQLADGLMVIPLPVEEQCRGVLSEPLSNVQLLTGDAKFNEAMGYPMVQQWRVRSNLYKVKLSAITLSTGFSKVLKTLTAESSREELLSFIQQYGSHYVSEALYGSELSCTIYFPSKKAQQQLWLQYQKVLHMLKLNSGH